MSARVQELFESKIRKVVLAFERGVEAATIARQVGVSAPTITKWLVREGYIRKKRGRVPFAMKARVRDLSLRGWDSAKIGSLLKLDLEQVEEWSQPSPNPILGGEKDPLKVKGQRRLKKDKVKRKRKIKEESDDWPPPKHRCGKHWTPIEKSYVLQLIESGIAPGVIYKRMRASRERQVRIWRENGGEGLPPNFPPPKDGVPGEPRPPELPAPPRGEGRKLAEAAAERLAALELASAARLERIRELEAAAVEEERKIRQLEDAQRQLGAERAAREGRLGKARAALELASGEEQEQRGRRRVLPGSYEHEELGLTPGSLIRASPAEYADNGRYFPVSRDWASLQDATDDELELFASHMTAKQFPAKVEASGDQPLAYFESTWPKGIDSKWAKAVDGGLDILERYQQRKATLATKKGYSKGIAQYLLHAYGSKMNKTPSERKAAEDEMLDAWARLNNLDRLVLIFSMKAAAKDGDPSARGVELGRVARRAIDKYEGEREAKAARQELKEAERREVEEILALAEAKRASGPTKAPGKALPPGDDSE